MLKTTCAPLTEAVIQKLIDGFENSKKWAEPM
jgi:hypothetical protein